MRASRAARPIDEPHSLSHAGTALLEMKRHVIFAYLIASQVDLGAGIGFVEVAVDSIPGDLRQALERIHGA